MRNAENDRIVYGLAAAAGALAFMLIYGVNVLNPRYRFLPYFLRFCHLFCLRRSSTLDGGGS